jgi:hypothetical protein
MATRISDFIESLRNGTADQGAAMTLWQATKQQGGRIVIDLAEPLPGWSLRAEPHGQNHYVVLVAKGEQPK